MKKRMIEMILCLREQELQEYMWGITFLEYMRLEEILGMEIEK